MSSLVLKKKVEISSNFSVIDVFEKASKKAGKTIVSEFGKIKNFQIKSKDVGDFVTTVDIKVEKIILETLQQFFPNASYITEESNEIKGDDETIVIDPIDGTSNFIHGIPLVGIVIGRIYDGEITHGVIFNPILNEFYCALKGGGAWCNNKKIMVSSRENIKDCLIGNSIPHANRGYKNYLREIDNIAKNCSGLRSTGAAAIDLAYVASGKTDAFWQRNLNLWDICSGILLVKEAGGKVSQPNGDKWEIENSDILVSNNFIHNQVLEKIK